MRDFIEKRLLCLSECGCYISIHDIVTLAQRLEITLPYKKRSLSLQTLFLEANAKGEKMKLFENLCTLLHSKKEQLFQFVALYPHTQALLTQHIDKIETTNALLQQECALHVKEMNHDA